MSPSLRRGVEPKASALLLALAAALFNHGCGGDDLGCGGPFCVSPPEQPEATQLKAGSGDGQTGAPGRELPSPIQVVVTDDDDRPVSGVMVSFAVMGGSGSLSSATAESDNEGHAEVMWTLGPEVGAQAVQAAATGVSGSPLAGSPLTFSADAVRPPPGKIVIHSAPSDAAQNGVPLQQQPVLLVLDADDQPVAQVEVVASIGSGGGALNGTTVVTSDGSGLVSYTDLAIRGTTGPHTLRFSVADPPLEVASGTIELTAGAPASIEGVEPLSYEGTVSSPVSPAPSVVVKDGDGNLVPLTAVTFTTNRDGLVSPETATTNEQGIAQVTSWSLGSTANVQYTLTARVESSALPAVVFSATASPGTAGRLRISVQPSSPTQNGTPFAQQPVIQVVDRNGNPAPQAGIPVTATVSSGPTGTVQNAAATTDAAGQAAFTGLTLTGLVGNYTVSFSASGLAGVNSNPVTITPGAAAKLAMTTAPSNTARSREPLATQPVLQVQDASGNSVAQPGISVVASIAPEAGSLGGETAITDNDGRAIFSALAITGSPGQKTLAFSSQGLQQISAKVTLPNVVAIVAQTPSPAPTVVGGVILNAASWLLSDGLGRPVADAPVTIAASPGGLVEPALTTSDGDGLVRLNSWTLGFAAGDQSVKVAVSEMGPSAEVHVQATPGPASQMVKFSGDAQEAPTDSALAEHLVVRAMDEHGNGVGGVTVQWRTCEGSGNFDAVTDAGGFSSARQETGSETGTFCTSASGFRTDGSPLEGSPAEFTYTVTAATPTPSQLRIGDGDRIKASGLPPVAPKSPRLHPSTSP